MLLRFRLWLRHELSRHLFVSLFFKRAVVRGARHMGRRREQPFAEAAADGSLNPVRGEYQTHAASQLKKFVMSVKGAVTRPLTRANARVKRARLNVANRVADHARCAADARDARPPLLGRAKGWLTAALVCLLTLDVSVAYSPVEQLAMSGLLTLLFSMAVVLLLNGLAAAVGWVGYRVFIEPDRSISYTAERILKLIIAVAMLIIAVVIYEFAELRAETGHSLLWGAVSVASVLLSILLGVIHHGDAPLRNLKRAERRLIRGQRRLVRADASLEWKTQIAEALGLHQRAVVVAVLAAADHKYRNTYEWRHRKTAPAIPDPGLLTDAEIVRLVLEPIGARRLQESDAPLALEPARP